MHHVRAVLFACFGIVFAGSAQAALIVELSRQGVDDVFAEFSGSGSGSQAFGCGGPPTAPSGSCAIGDNMGDYTTIDNEVFLLASPISLAPISAVDIIGLYIDSDPGVDQDEGGIYFDVSLGSPFNYNVSGSSLITGLSFSSLTPGTYTSSFGLDLTYIINDPNDAPAPASLGLLLIGLAGLYSARRKADR